MHPVSSHTISRCHSTQSNATLVRTLVTHNTNALHGQKDRTGLPDLVVQTSSTKRVDIDLVDVLQDFDLLSSDVVGSVLKEIFTCAFGPLELIANEIEATTVRNEVLSSEVACESAPPKFFLRLSQELKNSELVSSLPGMTNPESLSLDEAILLFAG